MTDQEPTLADRVAANDIATGLILRALATMPSSAGQQIAGALEETAVKFEAEAPGIATALRSKAKHATPVSDA